MTRFSSLIQMFFLGCIFGGLFGLVLPGDWLAILIILCVVGALAAVVGPDIGGHSNDPSVPQTDAPPPKKGG